MSERHEVQLASLIDLEPRVAHTEQEVLKYVGLVGRVDSLEQLRPEMADVRATVATTERAARMDRLDLRE